MVIPSFLHQQRRKFSATGGAFLPIIIVLGALIISAIIFFGFTRPALDRKKTEEVGETVRVPTDAGGKVTSRPAQASVSASAAPVPAKKGTEIVLAPKVTGSQSNSAPAGSSPAPVAGASVATAKAAPPPSFGFARPLDLGKEVLRNLIAGDFEKAGRLVAAGDPEQAATAANILANLVKKLGAKPGLENQIELLGMVENKTRISIPLILPGQAEPGRLQIDLERDAKMGWKTVRLHLSKEMATAIPPASVEGAAPMVTTSAPAVATSPSVKPSEPKAGSTPSSSSSRSAVAGGMAAGSSKGNSKVAVSMGKTKPSLFNVQETPDALTFANDFVQALLRHDFVTARKFVDEKKVPSERLAGLCIVFEEGQYEFKSNKPLVVTVANPEVSWVIAQVQSQALQQTTEFGIELQKQGENQAWTVVGLNLSEILGSFAASASKMGVPYTPIVNNPRGGESLALYFEYDRADLHPRAKKQLDIVAGLLKSDTSRKLQIAGHTDAKGTDRYNIELSRLRADSVKQQLVALGVSPEQIVTTGFGKAQPLDENLKADGSDNPEGRSKNRRAEIFLDF